MITNAGLVAGLIVGVAFLLAGVLLLKRGGARGGGLVTAGALVLLGAQLYGLAVLRPFVGRAYDEHWHGQIEFVEGFSTLGLLVCAAGILVHALALKKP